MKKITNIMIALLAITFTQNMSQYLIYNMQLKTVETIRCM
jgi:hypothetical protein